MVQQSLLQFLQDLNPTCVRYHLLSTFLSNKSLISLLLISRGCWSWCRFVGTSARRAASLWRVARRCFGSLCGGASARRTAGLQLQGRAASFVFCGTTVMVVPEPSGRGGSASVSSRGLGCTCCSVDVNPQIYGAARAAQAAGAARNGPSAGPQSWLLVRCAHC